jgi:pSer/pThr/pTyr-binding forkhead associated (FHA) protein
VDLIIPSTRISRKHAEIIFDPLSARYFLIDLESKNGTRVASGKLEPYEKTLLEDRESFWLADIQFVFHDAAPTAAEDLPDTLAGLFIDQEARQAFYDGAPVELSKNQFALLNLLYQHRGQLVSYHDILKALYGSRALYIKEKRKIQAVKYYLCQKLPLKIDTVNSEGYKLLD